MTHALRLSCLLASLFVPPAAQAEAAAGDPLWNGLSIRGFGTLGAARSTDSRAEFVRDLSQPDGLGRQWSGKLDSLLGLQANLSLGSNTEAVIQGVARYRYDTTWRPELTWAFLRHDFRPDFTVRLGRMGTEFFMQADSRNVGYANLTIRPSPDYFGPIVVSYFDGIDASLTGDTGLGLIRAKVFAGRAAEKAPFVKPYTWNLSGSRMAGGYIDYLNGPWQFRVSRSLIRFKHQQPINEAAAMAGIPFDLLAAAPELSIVGRHATYDSLGVAYDQGRLQVQAQLSRIRYDTAVYEDTRAAYIVAGYRFDQLTPFVGYARTRSDPTRLKTPLPPPVAAAIRSFTAATHSDQETFTLGARWDFQRDMALKAQVDLVRGNHQSHFPMRDVQPGWDGRMTVFSLALDFIF